MRIMRDNSGICELLDLAVGSVTQRKVYSVADWFLKEKDRIEKYLCQKTDDLFRPTNRIMLFDLTNFYFEGRKDGSTKARFGRSKEKRSDCKLLVLALCINTDGFIRYSAILEGNTADPKSLPAKALKEESMNRSFRKRFEEGLATIAASLTKKNGTKKYEPVIKRIGKLEGRFPSIARYYHIDVEKGKDDVVTSVTWKLEIPEKQVYGTYFLRTNVRTLDEKTTWDYYRSTSGRFACKEPDTRDRVLEPPAENRPQPPSYIPPEGRQERCPPVPRPALILDSERHTPPDEEGEREAEEGRPRAQGGIPHAVLDGDSAYHEHAEGRHFRGSQRHGREGGDENMQHADGTGC